MYNGLLKKLTVLLLASVLAFSQPTSSIDVSAKGKTSAFTKYLNKSGYYYKKMPKAYKSGYNNAKKTYKKGKFSWYGANMNAVTGKYFYMADHVAKKLAKKAKGKKGRYKKAAALHDALVKHCSYASGQYGGQSAYEALVGGRAVCAGYSRAYKLMCDIEGIPCMLVYGNASGGTGGGPHQWNIIKLDDGKWYEVDCTFDDPLGGKPNRNFFCLSTAKMASGTTPEGMSYVHQRTGLDSTTTALQKCGPKATSKKYDKKSKKARKVK